MIRDTSPDRQQSLEILPLIYEIVPLYRASNTGKFERRGPSTSGQVGPIHKQVGDPAAPMQKTNTFIHNNAQSKRIRPDIECLIKVPHDPPTRPDPVQATQWRPTSVATQSADEP